MSCLVQGTKSSIDTSIDRGGSRTFNRFAAVVAVLLVPASLHSQPPKTAAEELTLEQAVVLALQGNRDVRIAQLGIEKSVNEVAVARTYRLPSFDLNVFEGQFLAPVNFVVPAGTWGVYPATGPIPASASAITTPAHPFTVVMAKASEPLSRLHGIGLNIRLRELERDEAKEKSRAQQLETINQVRKLYYGILETQGALASNQASAATLREQDRVAKESVARQTALKSEELDVKARIARVDYEAATLQHSLATQKEQLNDVMGRDPRTEYIVSAMPDASATEPDLAAGLARALSERPEIREARLKVREARTDRDMQKTERIPEVTFDLQYFSAYRINLLPQNVGAAGFALKWDVFDWGRRKKEVANKAIVVDQAGIALKSVESLVAAEVEVQYRKVEDSQRLLDVAKAAQDAAREKVRVAGERHAQDTALMKELMEAQSSLAETDSQYQQALASYMSARADFDKATAVQ
jgi:outer membrane protein TolC